MDYNLSGLWNITWGEREKGKAYLPGTLDENRIGYKDIGANQWHPDAELGNAEETFDENAPICTRFTRKYTYQGEVTFEKEIEYHLPIGKRAFLEIERARYIRLFINNKEVMPYKQGTLSTPWIFEVTSLLQEKAQIQIKSDNSYPIWPKQDILYSSAATDETQTNWNGILGRFGIYTKEQSFVDDCIVLWDGKKMDVHVTVSSNQIGWQEITLASTVLKERISRKVLLEEGENSIHFEDLPWIDKVDLWDINEGNLYEMKIFLDDRKEKTVSFGMRVFHAGANGRLALNGREIFLLGETNCGVFPETGYEPMEISTWKTYMRQYAEYGVNCVRFHSHCPPEAAFIAADELGMLVQPELSNWNPKDAFGTEECRTYYKMELQEIIKAYGNHPSFVMLTLGNELHADKMGHEFMDEMIELAHSMDSTRLYANGSNVHYGNLGCDKKSDFYASQSWYGKSLRATSAGALEEGDVDAHPGEPLRLKGYLNNEYPNTLHNYQAVMKEIREAYEKPVFGFETGQYEVLPDFREIELFQGISDPVNLKIIKERAEKKQLFSIWEKYVEASGELALICYREEIEAAMRTKDLSGTFLLGLQDFPGQGTALVGMLNSHLSIKPYPFAMPKRFHAFFRECMILAQFSGYTYVTGESLHAEIQIANYGKKALQGNLKIELVPTKWGQTGNNSRIQSFENMEKKEFEILDIYAEQGKLSNVGMIDILLETPEKCPAVRYDLILSIEKERNIYPVWVYNDYKHEEDIHSIYQTKVLDETAIETLKRGGKVLLEPESAKNHLPNSIQGQFSTDFWSTGTFSRQEGGMGLFIEQSHPVFQEFPTEFYTNWQWWPMANARAVILPDYVKAIVTQLDSYSTIRHMGMLFEGRCYEGKLMVSTMGLLQLQEYPEARALHRSILHYMESDEFNPEQILNLEDIRKIIC